MIMVFRILRLVIFLFSSFHCLIILLIIEFFLINSIIVLFHNGFSFFCCLIFLLVGVCLGCYGVSLIVSVSRFKGVSYLLSFKVL